MTGTRQQNSECISVYLPPDLKAKVEALIRQKGEDGFSGFFRRLAHAAVRMAEKGEK